MLLPLEHLAVQMVPVLLKNSKHRCAFQSLLDQGGLSDQAFRSIAGNGMNLQICAMVFMYAIALSSDADAGN